MSDDISNKPSLLERLQKKSRYVRLNSHTFEEEKSFTLSPFNILIYLMFGVIVCMMLAYLLFSYTPFNSLIPNVPSVCPESSIVLVKPNLLATSLMPKTPIVELITNIENMTNAYVYISENSQRPFETLEPTYYKTQSKVINKTLPVTGSKKSYFLLVKYIKGNH